MALERVDPIVLEDCYAVDHLLRYALCAPFAEDRRVLDAACGSGFGALMLQHRRARSVVGVDSSEEAIAECRERWAESGIEFHQGRLEDLAALKLGKFGLITSFETLEHVEDPHAVVAAFREALEDNGILLGSVPGETDRFEQNPYHLRQFTRSSLRELLEGAFRNVRLYRQDFEVLSVLNELEPPSSANPLDWSKRAHLKIDFGKAGPDADTFVFVASNQEVPSLPLLSGASSRAAWRRMLAASHTTSEELTALYEKYRALFAEHGNFVIQFSNVLGWGQWHYEQHMGEAPEGTAMDRVVKAKTQREDDLRKQLIELQKERDTLKQQLALAENLISNLEDSNARTFSKASRDLESPDPK